MAIFRDTEPTRIKSQDAIQNGGDVAYEPMDLAVYQKNLENRIHKWQQQKWEMVKLLIHTNKRMELIEKQLLSPDVSTTLQ